MSSAKNTGDGSSLPVIVLTILGTVIAVIGLFAAGDLGVTALGLGTLLAAAVVGLAERLVTARISSSSNLETKESQ